MSGDNPTTALTVEIPEALATSTSAMSDGRLGVQVMKPAGPDLTNEREKRKRSMGREGRRTWSK